MCQNVQLFVIDRADPGQTATKPACLDDVCTLAGKLVELHTGELACMQNTQLIVAYHQVVADQHNPGSRNLHDVLANWLCCLLVCWFVGLVGLLVCWFSVYFLKSTFENKSSFVKSLVVNHMNHMNHIPCLASHASPTGPTSPTSQTSLTSQTGPTSQACTPAIDQFIDCWYKHRYLHPELMMYFLARSS